MSLDSEQLYKYLDALIVRDHCLLCFDQDLIDQLPDILVEHHGVATKSQARANERVARLFRLLDPSNMADFEIRELPHLVRQTGVDLSRYGTTKEVPRTDNDDFSHYSRSTGGEDRDAVLKLQRDLGHNLYKGESERYDPHLLDRKWLRKYLRCVSTVTPSLVERVFKTSFWGLQLKKWKLLGHLDTDAPSLSIGPRWLTEIHYFREIEGLRKHIGLDLYSSDEDLVVTGDMHEMPFPDDHFGFIFVKNTVDKSYDVRRLLDELIRVSRPNGILAIDGNCFHRAASILHRTDIQNAENLLRVLRPRTPLKVLACQTLDISGRGDAASGNQLRKNARLAVRILKQADGDTARAA